MINETILLERKDKIAVVTLNRPDAGNAHDGRMGEALDATWAELQKDENTWVVVLTGAGNRHFCTGADMRAASRQSQPGFTGRGDALGRRSDGILETRDLRDQRRTRRRRLAFLLAIRFRYRGGSCHFLGTACQCRVGAAAGNARPCFARSPKRGLSNGLDGHCGTALGAAGLRVGHRDRGCSIRALDAAGA